MEGLELAGVVHSAGVVFNGLTRSRVSTESFLRSGSRERITSRADLALLEDLRGAAEVLIDHQESPVGVDFLVAVNAHSSRSGALHPGHLRTADQHIGVPPATDRTPPTRIPCVSCSTSSTLQ